MDCSWRQLERGGKDTTEYQVGQNNWMLLLFQGKGNCLASRIALEYICKHMADLKMVYAAPDEAAALEELESFGEKWNSKYPKIYKSWSERWATLSTYFKYPNEVRKLIYTTNAIEGFNRQLRKVTKSKTVFPSDDSLLKMLYLATMDITKKWTGRRRDWSQIRAQLEIYFEERLEKAEF